MPENSPHRWQRLGVWIVFWLTPVAIVLSLFSVLTGQAASSRDLSEQDDTWSLQQWQVGVAQTPGSDSFSQKPTFLLTPTAQPEGIDAAETGGPFTLFMPLIWKFPLPPLTNLPPVFGPILDPPAPGLAQDIAPTPIIDPPTPQLPTPTPGGPPTPLPGTPTFTPIPPTPKPTVSPTPMPTATRILVENGNLESENGRGAWSEFSLRGYDLFFEEDSGELPNAPGGAFSGDWYIWLGGDNSEISYVERQLTVPNPANGDYRRYYLGHKVKLQSYDSVCATQKFTGPGAGVLLAGHLRWAQASTLDEFGVDLGGMIVCVNEPGRSGCAPDAVKDAPGGRQQIYVAVYELCAASAPEDWDTFLFPISSVTGLELAGETITVQIKAITDSQLSSSVLVDDVAWYAGPPLPTPTPTPISASVQEDRQPQIRILEPVLAPEAPSLPGARFAATGQSKSGLPIHPSDAFLKNR